MATIKEYRIRHITAEGAAYGVNMETGDEVFINPGLIDRMQIEMGDLVRAAVIPNVKSEEVKDYAQMVEALEE